MFDKDRIVCGFPTRSQDSASHGDPGAEIAFPILYPVAECKGP